MDKQSKPKTAARTGRPKRWLATLLLATCLQGPLATPAQTASKSFKEYDVKAVFLFNFAQFVEWPDSAFSSTNAPLVIGVLGRDPFGAILDKTVQGEHVRGRPLEVRRFARAQDVSGCHLLFIGAGDKNRRGEMIQRSRGRPILTVSDEAGFDHVGGMIALRTADGRVRFSIDKAVTDGAGLKISAKLLNVAQNSRREP